MGGNKCLLPESVEEPPQGKHSVAVPGSRRPVQNRRQAGLMMLFLIHPSPSFPSSSWPVVFHKCLRLALLQGIQACHTITGCQPNAANNSCCTGLSPKCALFKIVFQYKLENILLASVCLYVRLGLLASILGSIHLAAVGRLNAALYEPLF